MFAKHGYPATPLRHTWWAFARNVPWLGDGGQKRVWPVPMLILVSLGVVSFSALWRAIHSLRPSREVGGSLNTTAGPSAYRYRSRSSRADVVKRVVRFRINQLSSSPLLSGLSVPSHIRPSLPHGVCRAWPKNPKRSIGDSARRSAKKYCWAGDAWRATSRPINEDEYFGARMEEHHQGAGLYQEPQG